MNQQPTAAQSVQQLNTALSAAFTRKEDGQAQVDAANTEIVAIRNVLAGVTLGQNLQKEVDAEMVSSVPTK